MARKRTDKVLALANKADMILSSHFQSGNNEIIYKEFNTTIANLKTSANIFYPFVVITDVGKEGMFKYDSTDIISVNDDVYVIVDSSGRRWKRTSDIVNTKLQYVLTTAELQAFTQSTLAHYDGSVWEKKSGNVASNGGDFAGTLIRISSTTYWERQIIKYVTFEMFGAKGDGITDDYIPISNTLLNATNIFVSGKTFISSQPISQIQSNTTIIGLGKKSEIKFTYPGESHFFLVINRQNVLIDNIYINANTIGRLTGGLTAQLGGAIVFSNSEVTNTPRINNITIQNCFIGCNGFNGIGGVNVHAVSVFNNYFYEGRDSGIAAVQGSSQWNIAGNHFEDTNQYQISLSNNGISQAEYAAVGFVRDCIIKDNFINNKGLGGYGIELDGIDGVKVSGNIITMNQSCLYGIRLISSYVYTNDFDVYNVDISNNTIINKSTADRVGIDIFNNGTQSANHNITITENTITNQIESTFKGIVLLNSSVKCSKNIINSTTGKYTTGILLDVSSVNNGIKFDLSENDISGGVQGIGTTNLTNEALIILTRNKIYGNTIACLGINTGWNLVFNQNLLTGDIYNSGLTMKGDHRYYSAAPTTGTWLINEIVYNVTPVSGGYMGFICTSGGTPGTWKGFGLIE